MQNINFCICYYIIIFVSYANVLTEYVLLSRTYSIIMALCLCLDGNLSSKRCNDSKKLKKKFGRIFNHKLFWNSNFLTWVQPKTIWSIELFTSTWLLSFGQKNIEFFGLNIFTIGIFGFYSMVRSGFWWFLKVFFLKLKILFFFD